MKLLRRRQCPPAVSKHLKGSYFLRYGRFDLLFLRNVALCNDESFLLPELDK